MIFFPLFLVVYHRVCDASVAWMLASLHSRGIYLNATHFWPTCACVIFSFMFFFFFFFFDWVCVWAGCLVWSSALCSSACVCLCVCTENERCVRWLFSTVSHNNCAYRAHRQTPRFHPLCCGNSLYNFLSGVRKGMAVSTITAVKAGLLFFLFFFFSGPETARYARWCNTYKGVF